MNRILFIVYTPLQLISAISTIKTYNLENVDYIISHPNMEKYLDIFSKYFDGNQIVCEQLYDKPNKYGVFFKRIIIFFNIIRKKVYLKNIDELKQKYSKLFVPSDDSSCRVIYNIIKKNNDNVQLLLYDDGVATYIGTIFFKKSLISRLIYKIFLDSEFCKKIEKLYCFHPEIIITENIDICKIENLKNMDIFIQKKDNLIPYLKKKVIFLDQGLNLDIIDDMFKILLKYFKKDEIIIKKHPRLESSIDYSDYIVSEDGLPVEAIFSSLDCSESLIISHSSTGCLTPYLLMNIFPKVIMLLNLDSNKCILEEHHKLFNKINRINEVEYIKIPKDIEEFEMMIKNVKSDIKEIKEKF